MFLFFTWFPFLFWIGSLAAVAAYKEYKKRNGKPEQVFSGAQTIIALVALLIPPVQNYFFLTPDLSDKLMPVLRQIADAQTQQKSQINQSKATDKPDIIKIDAVQEPHFDATSDDILARHMSRYAELISYVTARENVYYLATDLDKANDPNIREKFLNACYERLMIADRLNSILPREAYAWQLQLDDCKSAFAASRSLASGFVFEKATRDELKKIEK